MKIFVNVLLVFAAMISFCGCQEEKADANENHIVMSLGKRIASLDPVMAADTTSQNVICAFYDTLLQYRYTQGEYTLEPSMLESMPEPSADGMTYTCKLRNDLYFAPNPAFDGMDKEARKIKSSDVVFSLLRLADTRLRSPCYWVIRGRIAGLDDFRHLTASAPDGDFSPYDQPCKGFTILSDTVFRFHLTSPNPRFLYSLALPSCSIVSRRAVRHYGEEFARNPAGSGPYRIEKWEQDYVLEMIRNPDFRKEYYVAASGEDKQKTLPFADRITCYLVKQPVSSWLMFLQGGLDYYALDADHFESVVNGDDGLSPVLTDRGISLKQAPELETNYIGFNFSDPLLGKNRDLRIAVTLAFDKKMRILHSSGRFIPAYGPVPPGVHGHVDKDTMPFPEQNTELAKEYMKKAGFPGGIDPRTGKALELSFDQTGSDTFYRQTAELLAQDLGKIGIKVIPEFNTRPRFLQKLATGSVQLFRLSWTGDYPDAENFLQLFYGPNAGSCNRVYYCNPAYDAMYEEILTMPDSPERTEKYKRMAQFLGQECPWVFETNTMSFILTHRWLKYYLPHAFAFNRWKYLSSDSAEREAAKKSFRPLSMTELR